MRPRCAPCRAAADLTALLPSSLSWRSDVRRSVCAAGGCSGASLDTLPWLSGATSGSSASSLRKPRRGAAGARGSAALDLDYAGRLRTIRRSLVGNFRSAGRPLAARAASSALDAAAVAIVGSRAGSPYALAVAERLAADLATRGIVIVSGLARGVDSSGASRRALRQRMPLIGVLGSGADIMYPAEHKPLAREMIERGRASSSELAPGTRPLQAILPAAQPDHQRTVARGGRNRGRRKERIAHHGAVRARAGTRRSGSSRQRPERPQPRRPRAVAGRCKDCGVRGRYLEELQVRPSLARPARRRDSAAPRATDPVAGLSDARRTERSRRDRRAIRAQSIASCCRDCSSSNCRVWCARAGGGRFVRV
mgnify:CR=1 FL=1